MLVQLDPETLAAVARVQAGTAPDRMRDPRTMRRGGWALLLLVTACDAAAPAGDAERGRLLFEAAGTEGLSPSRLNVFACATCHDATIPASPGATKPGAPLAGATLRPSYWGGQENDLLAALNACRAHFMVASAPLEATEPAAAALYAYLLSLEPGDPRPRPFTVVRTVLDLPAGDVARGQAGYEGACAPCHGSLHDGVGRLGPRIPVLPEQAISLHPGYDTVALRVVFLEKTRHGGFLGYGGDMPPFSEEVLPDSVLADIVQALLPNP